MASGSSAVDKNSDWKNRAFLGSLPDDFLKVTVSPQQQQEAVDQQTAYALQHQFFNYGNNYVGRLRITVAQAKLVKNYGMTRMDPYVRLRVGHCVYETHTDQNAGKNPRWNKVIHCLIPSGVNSIHLEIYDECSFTMDELIAWAEIPIPQSVITGETHENWYPLSGKQGEGLEGMVNLVLSYSANPGAYAMYAPVQMLVPSVGSEYSLTQMPVYPAAAAAAASAEHPPTAAPPALSEEELKQIQEMFPNIDKDVIKSVSEANRGNRDATVNSLLQMSE